MRVVDTTILSNIFGNNVVIEIEKECKVQKGWDKFPADLYSYVHDYVFEEHDSYMRNEKALMLYLKKIDSVYKNTEVMDLAKKFVEGITSCQCVLEKTFINGGIHPLLLSHYFVRLIMELDREDLL